MPIAVSRFGVLHVLIFWALLPQGALAERLTAEQAVALALQANPALARMGERAMAGARVPAQAGALPDPQLSFGLVGVPADDFALDQEPMTQRLVQLSQQIPFAGKRGLRRRAAESEAAAAHAEAQVVRLILIRDVRLAWSRLHYLDRALDILARNRQLLDRLVEVAQTRYRVGRGLQQDVLLAQLERSGLLEREFQLRNARRAEAARLNALLDRPAHADIVVADETLALLPNLPPAQALRERALAEHPVMRAQTALQQSARTRLALASRDRYPDFVVTAGYGVREASANGAELPDLASITLTMSLPVFAGDKQSQAIAQRRHELEAQRLAVEAQRSTLLAEIQTHVADYERAREQLAFLREGLLPQARQTVASMLAGYEVNKVDFLNLARAQIVLHDYETRYQQVLSESHQALARLAAAVGQESLP